MNNKVINIFVFFGFIFITSCGGKYRLQIENTKGDGKYSQEAKIKLSTNKVKEDSIFNHWIGGKGYIDNVYAPQTFLVMPSQEINVKAIYQHKSSTGIKDIDLMRKAVKAIKTDTSNLEERRAGLYRYYRLLWRQGYNLISFDDLAKKLLNPNQTEEEKASTIDLAFNLLDELYENGDLTKEISGIENAIESQKTNWARAFGIDGKHVGYSPDNGPNEGEIDWKFAKGYFSVAKPIIQDGKIYLSSPGIDVMGYCLEEESGEVNWTARQFGTNFYEVHSCRLTPVVTKNSVFYRTGGEKTPLFVVDKKTGKISKAKSINRHYSANTDKGKSIFMFDADTGEKVWGIEGDELVAEEPVVGSKSTFFNLIDGKVSAVSNTKGEVIWSTNLKTTLHAKPTLILNDLYISTEKRELVKLNSETGEKLWSFVSDDVENKCYQYFSSPIESNGVIYIGAASKYLYAINSETGKLIWKNKMSDWVRSAPKKIGDLIYVATLDGKLHALKNEGTNANLIFTKQINNHGFTADIEGTENGVLLIGRDLIMYSVSPITGNINWKHGVLNGAFKNEKFYAAGWSGGLLGSPTVVDDVVYIGGPDGFVNAVEYDTGKEIWRFETNSSTSLALTVAEGKVFFGYLGSFSEHYGYEKHGDYFAVDKNNGEPVWTSKEFGKVWVSAGYNKGNIFIGNVEGDFFAVNAGTGEKIWKYYSGKNTIKETMPKDTPFRHGYPPGVYSCPIVDENNVYFGSWAGYYFSLDQKTGKLNWRSKTQANDFGGLPDSAAPSLHKGNLYVQKQGGFIAALDVKTGKLNWQRLPHLGYLQNATISAHNDNIFGSAANRVTVLPYESKMIAYHDVENGSEKIWETRGLGGLTPPVLTDENIISGSSTNMFVTCLNQNTGEIKWRVFTGGEMMENGPAIYGNRFYALVKNGYLISIK